MKTNSAIKGISVIICCYNSEERITETLYSLAKQQVARNIYWEIILVDNASTDNTATLSRSLWTRVRPDVRFNIVYEARPGLGYARKTGIEYASCKFVLFCDDDNWLNQGYVEGIYFTLLNNPDIAACGGKGLPVFEIPKPFWFDEYQEAYATGAQDLNKENGRILNLYGAGLGINREMLAELEIIRFKPLLTDRVGKSLSSAGDTELTYALVLMGYRLHYAEDLDFYHYLPKERLSLSYIQRLYKAFGTDGPIRNIYYSQLTESRIHKYIRSWVFHLLLAVFRLVKYYIIPPKKYGRNIYFHWSLSYIKQLFHMRRDYHEIAKNISGIRQSYHQQPEVSQHTYKFPIPSTISQKLP